jgi:hypothetical protein
MIFARNRKVGSFSDIDCGRACFDNPTSNSPLYFGNQQNRERQLPGPKQKSKGEWIKGRKPYRAGGDRLAAHKMRLFGLDFAGYFAQHRLRRAPPRSDDGAVRDRRGCCRTRSSSGQKALAAVLPRLDNFVDETSAAFAAMWNSVC